MLLGVRQGRMAGSPELWGGEKWSVWRSQNKKWNGTSYKTPSCWSNLSGVFGSLQWNGVYRSFKAENNSHTAFCEGVLQHQHELWDYFNSLYWSASFIKKKSATGRHCSDKPLKKTRKKTLLMSCKQRLTRRRLVRCCRRRSFIRIAFWKLFHLIKGVDLHLLPLCFAHRPFPKYISHIVVFILLI